MKISLDWISDFVKLPKASPLEMGRALTHHTAEVEGVEDQAAIYSNMVVGEVLELKKHPGADRLNLAQVDIGAEAPVQIVCGGSNLKPGLKVPVALPGAHCRWHGEGELVEITETKIRGEHSYGMICAGEEIGLPTDNPPGATTVRICELANISADAGSAKNGTPLAKALGKEGAVIEIDNKSLTHRPDLWGHYGMAREIAAIYGEKLAPLDSFLKIPSPKGTDAVHIDIQDNDLCSRFSTAIMTGVKIEASPAWMKARLEAAGMNAHNNIVDITNYVMLELGQPMHAYDRAILGSDILRVRYAKKGEKLLTLEGTEHPLTTEDPVVCDGKDQPAGVAGVKGGMKSGISEATTEIILEAAHWNPVVVRKTSMRQALRTDASQRFEKSLDPTLTELAIQRAIHLILELCPGATLAGPVTTTGVWQPKKLLIMVDPESVCSKIGVKIPVPKMTAILKALDFDVEQSGEKLAVTVPSHRASKDVSIEEDIVEEVARMYGYNAIPAILPAQPIQLPEENVERTMEHNARRILALHLGFTEVKNYSFYSLDRLRKCGLEEKDHLTVLNYLSLDQTHMRTSLTPNLLANIADNEREQSHIQIFEIGHTYKEIGQYMPLEKNRLTGMVAHNGECFYEAKGALEAFLKSFGVSEYELVPSKKPLPYAHPKKSMDLKLRGEVVGVLFTLHPATLKAYGVGLNAAAFSIEFTELVVSGKSLQKFSPLPKFPALPFDISILVDRQKTVGEMENLIRGNDPEKLVKEVKLFDIYEGKNIPTGKKSLSFRVTLRREDRTLNDTEFQAFYSSLSKALASAGGTIRGL